MAIEKTSAAVNRENVSSAGAERESVLFYNARLASALKSGHKSPIGVFGYGADPSVTDADGFYRSRYLEATNGS